MGRPRPFEEPRPRKGVGRPRVYDQRVPLATRVLPSLRDRVARQATRRGISISQYIADIIDRHTP